MKFAPITRLDVKSAFLNDNLNEERFVEQLKGFVNPTSSEHMYKLWNTLYGLKQAPRAWYDCLTWFLIKNGYVRGGVNKTLFIKKSKGNFIIAQVYVDNKNIVM